MYIRRPWSDLAWYILFHIVQKSQIRLTYSSQSNATKATELSLGHLMSEVARTRAASSMAAIPEPLSSTPITVSSILDGRYSYTCHT